MLRHASVLGGLALGLLLSVALQSLPTSAQSSVVVGIDVEGSGNGGVSVTSVESCRSVGAGDELDIDIYVQNVSDLAGWETYLTFSSDKLEFVEAEPKMFLQSLPGSRLLVQVDVLGPGRHFIGAADSSNAYESGSGVLARVTLKATGSGIASIELEKTDADGDGKFDKGTRLSGDGRIYLGDTDGDGVYDGPSWPAYVAIDQSCSAAPTPGPGQGSGDGNPQPTPTALTGSDDGDAPDDDDDPNGGGSGSGGSGGGIGGGAGDSGDGDDDDPSGNDDDGGGSGGGDGGSEGDVGSDQGNDGNRGEEAAGDASSGGLSNTLIIILALLGAGVVTVFVMLGLRGAWRPSN